MKRKNRWKEYCKQYALGVDWYGLTIFLVLLIVNLIAMCIPVVRVRFEENNALDYAALVFQAIAVILLVFLVKKEEEKLNFSSPLILFMGICLILYYIAWIFLFCNYLNAAVYLFLAVFPCAALILFEVERKNWFALVPTVIFAVLHIVSACINYL